MDGSLAERLQLNALIVTYAFVYALSVTVLATIGALILGVATGGGLVRTKILLFVVGWVLMAYAVIRLWPRRPSDVADNSAGPSEPGPATIPADGARTRFQAAIRRIPARWLPLPPPERRITSEGKLFLASLLVLLTSFLMETVFGVA